MPPLHAVNQACGKPCSAADMFRPFPLLSRPLDRLEPCFSRGVGLRPHDDQLLDGVRKASQRSTHPIDVNLLTVAPSCIDRRSLLGFAVPPTKAVRVTSGVDAPLAWFDTFLGR